ncbi:MAG: heavy metal transport/detoxification protein, partial [Clostridium sp.]
LVKKTKIANDTQSLTISGIGYEFSPIIAIAQSGLKTNLSIDLTKFDNAEGSYSIIDANSIPISSFEGKTGINQVELTFEKPGIYGIIKDDRTLALIDVSEDIKPIVPEELRDKYLK